MDAADRPLLDLSTGWMNAAGFSGFAPQAGILFPQPPVAFVTNPISYQPRNPSAGRACFHYPGGFLLHTGWPNPGFRRTLSQFAERWSRAEMPVWVHLLAEKPHELDRMVRVLEDTEGVTAVELSFLLSADKPQTIELIHAAAGELPVIAAVPLEQVNPEWAAELISQGVSALTLTAPRGMIPAPSGALVRGRMYGPGLFPQVVNTVNCLREVEMPIIAGCGVFNQAGIDTLLDLGAAAVQLDAVLWTGWENESCS